MCTKAAVGARLPRPDIPVFTRPHAYSRKVTGLPDHSDLASIPLVTPAQTDPPRTPGVYSWWLDTARFPTPKSAGLIDPPTVSCLPHRTEQAELLYVGRARRNLHQRILRQYLRRTRSSTLRRTLLAALLTGDARWNAGASLDTRRRVVLSAEAEDRLTAWMTDHLLMGWVPRASKDETDTLETQWVEEHHLALNTDGTEHGPVLTDMQREFVTAMTSAG